MRRVVVTGLGIVSSIGNNVQEVLDSLHNAKPGIVKADDYARLGFRCQVHASNSAGRPISQAMEEISPSNRLPQADTGSTSTLMTCPQG